jgi:quinol monooxygenase YgiN
LASGFAALVAPTRAESGCINYDLHRSNDDPSVWMLYENWRSPDDLEQHFKRPTSKNSRQAATKYWATIWIFGAFR